MKLEFNNFTIYTDYISVNKKEINVFLALDFFEEEILDDVFELIEFVEFLKLFASNRLDTSVRYLLFDKIAANVATKEGKIKLKLYFADLDKTIFLDKFAASSLAAKFAKVLQRCVAWQE